ncbi:MAG: glycoside hydrolase family 9 protein, partial [Verrucomicrobiota bacterium]|nr:glycoside hydrolase family 9 protein [Verrucomicrobiota bacterium]
MKKHPRPPKKSFFRSFDFYLQLFLAGGLAIISENTFAENAKPEIFIRANQIGYRPSDPKIALAFAQESLPEKFMVVEAETQKVFVENDIKTIAGSWGKFTQHAELDFSEVKKPGKYFIRLGQTQSPVFAMGDGVLAELPDQLLEFMRQQRCGYNPWLDAVCHSFDGRTAYGPMTNGTYLNCSGGWHDAGDLLKYLLTSGNATAQMLLAYQMENEKVLARKETRSATKKSEEKVEENPVELKSIFADHFNELGQSGSNGIPDILDEAKWGLDWMLKLHPARDQLFHQVADDRDHHGWRLPQNENVDYGWGEGKERVVYFADGKPQGLKEFKSESTGVANLAGRYAAAMALAYQIWNDDERLGGFAKTCLRAAMEVYALGKTKEGVQQGNSYGAPYRYAETTWADDMEWGAAELFRATSDARYIADAKHYAQLASTESWMGREQTGHYQYYP